jgi:hypothetical protein
MGRVSGSRTTRSRFEIVKSRRRIEFVVSLSNAILEANVRFRMLQKIDTTNISYGARLVLKAHIRWSKLNMLVPPSAWLAALPLIAYLEHSGVIPHVRERECWTHYAGFVKEHALEFDIGQHLWTMVKCGVLTTARWDEVWAAMEKKWGG